MKNGEEMRKMNDDKYEENNEGCHVAQEDHSGKFLLHSL